jgi:anti-sigma B factor antagonist
MTDVRLSLSGEIDLADRDDLEHKLNTLIRCCGDDLVVDCAAVTFIDSSGIGALVDARNRLYEQGRRLRLVALPDSGRRVVEILDLTMFLNVEDASVTTHLTASSV